MQKVSGADMGYFGRTGVSRALRKSPGVKKHGEHARDGPGARFGQFWGQNGRKATRKFWKMSKNFRFRDRLGNWCFPGLRGSR